MSTRWTFALLLCATALAARAAAPAPWSALDEAQRAELAARVAMPDRQAATNLGVVSCASSTCHGSVVPWEQGALRNEYVTWSRFDRHARAYATLLAPESVAIARKLGLSRPAHEAPECLVCHTYAPPEAHRGERFVLSDGISCEGCHGPAEGWIASHTEPTARHADNLRQGLYPTSDPVGQARLCVSCHVGDGDRWVTHRIMGAGHPRLGFELSTFKALQPPHYRIDADWIARKGSYAAGRTWALGQLYAARALLERLADPVRGRDGLFPELSVFDCHACHHPMSDQRWTPRLGLAPGTVRINDGHLLMLRAITEALIPDQAAPFRAAVQAAHRAVSAGDGAVEPALRGLLGRLDALVPRLRELPFDDVQLRAVVHRLITIGQSGEYADYAGAEQAYMSIAPLVEHLAAEGRLGDAERLRRALAHARATLASEEAYRAERFREALAALAAAIGGSVPKEG